MKVEILDIVFLGFIVAIASFVLISDKMSKINTNIKWIMAIGLLIVGILLKNTFI